MKLRMISSLALLLGINKTGPAVLTTPYGKGGLDSTVPGALLGHTNV
jgi:hypothetical protein